MASGRRPLEHLGQQRLLDARPTWRERHGGRDSVHAQHQQHVLHRPADVERLEQEPERGEPAQPARELDQPDLAQVAAAIVEDRQPLLHPRPERPHAGRQDRHRGQRQDGQCGNREQRELRVLGEVGEVERAQVGEVGRLREDALREREREDEHRHRQVEDVLDGERRADRRVARPRHRGLGQEQADDVAAARGDHAVEAVAGEVGGPDFLVAERLRRVGRAQDVERRPGPQAQVAGEENIATTSAPHLTPARSEKNWSTASKKSRNESPASAYSTITAGRAGGRSRARSRPPGSDGRHRAAGTARAPGGRARRPPGRAWPRT